MVNPLRLRFTHIKFIVHSKAMQIREGIFIDGSERMTICMQMSRRLTALMRWCSLMSLEGKVCHNWSRSRSNDIRSSALPSSSSHLRTPLPLALVATRRCHSIPNTTGRPRTRPVTQMTSRVTL